jgi:hypothetical protein
MNPQPPAHHLDQCGPLLNAREMARVFGITVSQFYRRERLGQMDRFKVRPVLGPRCYSKTLVQRYLDGDPLDAPVFGRKRA